MKHRHSINRIMIVFAIAILGMTNTVYAGNSATIIYSGDMKGYVEPCPS